MSRRSHRARVLRVDPHDPPGIRFRRAISAAILTVLVPGSAHCFLGSKRLGRLALAVWFLLVLAAGWVLFLFRTDRARVLGWAGDTQLTGVVRIVLVVLVVSWLALFFHAWRLAWPRGLGWARVGAVGTVYLAITGLVGVSAATAVNLISVQRDVVNSVFTAQETVEPLRGRYNVLLLGADSGADRRGLRPDSINVANIDADTGKIVLVSLPRNLEKVPFRDGSPLERKYPRGYNCGDECLLNAVYLLGEENADLFPGDPNPGLTATKDAVEGATGLPISYTVTINMQGFSSLVDAVGGVEVDVQTKIAKFGAENRDKTQFIPAGRQILNGENALWYARSRVQSDDYTRMARQKCLMSAMVDQLDPQTVVLNASAIGESSKELFSTDLPASELGRFADLMLKARANPIATISLVPPLVDVTDPDFDEIRDAVQAAVDPSSVTAEPTPSPTPTPTEAESSPSPSPSPTTSIKQANRTDDLAAVC